MDKAFNGVIAKASDIKASKAMIAAMRNVNFAPSEELYADVTKYMAFIGDEVEENANFGAQLAYQALAQGFSVKTVVETAAGTGAMAKDVIKVAPESTTHAVEWDEQLCRVGRELNPHIAFHSADMTGWRLYNETADIVMNSASSLGFLTVEQLARHFATTKSYLSEAGSYFMDIGWYACLQVTNVNLGYADKYGKNGEARYFTSTPRYYPVSDIHEIAYVEWDCTNPDNPIQKSAFSHKLRAYRFSEIKYLAAQAGLNAKLYAHTHNKALGAYEFVELDENSIFTEPDQFSGTLIQLSHLGKQVVNLANPLGLDTFRQTVYGDFHV